MHFRLKPVVAGLCLLGLIHVPAFAADKATNQEEIIKKLNERTLALEAELKELRAEIKQLHSEKVATKRTVIVKQTVVEKPVTVAQATQTTQATGIATTTLTTQKVPVGKVGAAGAVAAQQAKADQMPQNVVFEEPASIPTAEPTIEPLFFLSKTPLYFGGAPVVVSPMVGLRSDTDISDLIVNLPSVNEDLRILRQRQEITGLYEKFGLPVPNQPVVDVSGKVEAQASAMRPYVGNRRSDIDLTSAELDFAIFASKWATAFMAITYDNSPPAPGTGRRVDNSRLAIDKAFFSIGNLMESPIYGTAGQFFVPFGQYGSYLLSNPLTKFVGRIKARAVLLGYNQVFNQHHTINGSIFAFRGDSSVSGTPVINQYGANLDYTYSKDKLAGDIAMSYIANIADSQGMQGNGGPSGFTGFATTSATSEILIHKVPGFDVRGSIGYGDFDVIAEYVTATKGFSPLNLTYNNYNAQPNAFHIEGVYNFRLWGHKSLIAAAYDQTNKALALLLPQRRYAVVFSTSIWDWTIASLEYRHDINYAAGNVASGQGLAVVPTGLGNTSDTVTFQMGVYF